jgi:hypothetical protein
VKRTSPGKSTRNYRLTQPHLSQVRPFCQVINPTLNL